MDFKGYSYQQIRERYFSEEKNSRKLKKGEILMKQGAKNDRLYLLIKGKIIAYVSNEAGNKYEVFRINPGMFAGVYSFFSGSYMSRTTMEAVEDSELLFLEAQPFEEREDTESEIRFLLPVILSDLNARMESAHQMASEKEEAITQLLKAEKMATLGQLAAGLAHELNNAVSVLKSKSDWLARELDNFFRNQGAEVFDFYHRGLETGQAMSSREVREDREKISVELGVDRNTAKRLARTGLPISTLKEHRGDLERLIIYWEIGAAFHDMGLASEHASQVVQSVKELGAGSAERKSGLDINKTLRDALTLIQSVLRQVEVQTELKEGLYTMASSGELVQVWINLLKNACESMINSRMENPVLRVETSGTAKWITVRVIDNGPGIPDDIIGKIFQPNVTTKKGGLSFGLGLGLPISLNIIQDYNGSISVNSNPGRTEFIVKLPVA